MLAKIFLAAFGYLSFEKTHLALLLLLCLHMSLFLSSKRTFLQHANVMLLLNQAKILLLAFHSEKLCLLL